MVRLRGYDEGWRAMGRRTEGRRAGGRGARSWYGRVLTAAAAAALCVSLTLVDRAAAAASEPAEARTTAVGTSTAAEGTPGPYSFAEDATTVEGAADTTYTARLEPGHTYRSSIGPAGKEGRLYYRLELDPVSTAYVAATAIPRPGVPVSYSDGLKVSLQDADGRNCTSSGTAHFGATQSPHPIAAWASRETGGKRYACQTAGTYYAVVERTGAGTAGATNPAATASSSSPVWDLELSYVSEPGLKEAPASTSAPETWNSESPEALAGDPKHRGGGAGFSGAGSLGQGVWQDDISPGQTRFYEVPVGWGQRLYATASLGSSSGGGGSVGTAMTMSLYNPVRGFVDDVASGYDGGQRSAALRPLPPVAYENRYAISDRVSGMRFAGSYYLVVHLAEQVGDHFGEVPFGLTLRVSVAGAARTGPAYAGPAKPQDVFEVPVGDSDDATDDATDGGTAGAGDGGGGGRSGTMKLVAAGGIGTGSTLMLTLGMWTLVARRRAVASSGPAPEDADTASDQPPTPGRAPWEHGATRGR
jgi:hypothetical protein